MKVFVFDKMERLGQVLCPYMEAKYKLAKPDLYLEFMMAIKKSIIARRKRALQGRITDTEGRALHRVRVSVDGKKPVVKRGSKGNYFFRNLTNAKHELSFSCEFYHTVKKTVVIYPGKTTKLDVVLHPVKTAELVEV